MNKGIKEYKYTGIFDINNKEVKVGDIVKANGQNVIIEKFGSKIPGTFTYRPVGAINETSSYPISDLTRSRSIEVISTLKNKYTWKDIVEINGKFYAEEFEISGIMDDENTYQIGDFIDSVAKKYNVDSDDVKTYMMDNIEFNPKELPFGAEDCGCYINGIPEWFIS